MIGRIFTSARRRVAAARARLGRLLRADDDFTQLKMLAARALIAQMRTRRDPQSFADVEFRVFSQFGDDGIIQYLVRALEVPHSVARFIEFGVEDYRESNTRFLLMNDNWSGLIIDGSAENMKRVRSSDYFWRHDLTAVASFITRDNINGVIADNGFAGEIALLSIDIDGNDYWVWERITVVQPWIVVAEYNSVYGPKRAVTVPYDASFQRTRAHFSNLYWGCSLKALDSLARRKGYTFVGCNTAGNNAYFVRDDKVSSLGGVSVMDGYVASRFRESRDINGELTFVRGTDRLRVISDQQLYDVELGRLIAVSELIDQ